MLNQELDSQVCPHCGATGTLKREVVGKANVINCNMTERRYYGEPEKTPVKRIRCQRCKSFVTEA